MASSPPLHGLSVGESLRVYGDGDRNWRHAEITAVGDDHRCEVLYGDGEREWLSLAERKYIVDKDWKGSLRRKRKVGNDDDGEKAEREIDTVQILSLDSGNSLALSCRRSKRLQQKKLSIEASEIMCSSEDQDLSKVVFSCLGNENLEEDTPKRSTTSSSCSEFEGSSDVSSVQNALQTRRSTRRSAFVSHRVTRSSTRRKGSKSIGNAAAAKKECFYSREVGHSQENLGCYVDYWDSMCVDSVMADNYGSPNALLCSACQTAASRDSLIRCVGAGCVCAMHTFCLSSMKEIDANWLCPFCEKDSPCTKGLTKNKTLIRKKVQSIVGHRRIKINDKENALQNHFLIKWKSLSHHHDSWVPLEWIHAVDRLRLWNYQRKYFSVDEESLIDHRKPEWFKVDRVIACRKKCYPDRCICASTLSLVEQDRKEMEFLVKWMGLGYDDVTWESSWTEDLSSAISKFVKRHQRAAEKTDKNPSHTIICRFEKTPEYLSGGHLYDYQLEGLNWILRNFSLRNNVILADEMGLGKTVQVVSFIKCMKHENLSLDPVLIIAPKSILFHWEQEFSHWTQDLNVIIYHGEKQSRHCIQLHELYSSGKEVLFDVLVTNYELVVLDNKILKKIKWSAIIIDEAHKIKGLDCKLASCLNQHKSDFKLLLTGTPLQNTLLELFGLLHFLDPEKFSEPKSEAQFFSTIGSKFNDESSNSDLKVSQIHELLRPRMLRRMKSGVLPGSIPAKKWVEIPCALTDFQRELYINILGKNYKKLNDGIQSGRKITLNFILMELKKCCNHPYLFPGQEPCQISRETAVISLIASSGKLQLLEKLLPKLKERGNRVLLFSQMTKMLDILEEFLTFLGLAYFRIDGQTPISLRKEQMQEFNSPGCPVFLFLISTRAGGLGIDLPTADRVILYDPDFNPFMDLQAQSRAHRIGQKRPVVVYQLITKCTVEEKILQKSKRKLAIEHLVMNPSRQPNVKDLHSILLHGAKKILSRKEKLTSAICYDDNAIETLVRLDPTPDEKYVPDDNGYLGSIHSFESGNVNESPSSPKAEDWETILGPVENVPDDGELGRGKRQKKAINYACEEETDNDEIYSPESGNIDVSSDEDTGPGNDEIYSPESGNTDVSSDEDTGPGNDCLEV